MDLKYTKLVIDRSRFAAGKYDINLANEAERELAAMQARIEALETGIKLAQSKLRSTQINWQEDCLFDCDDILTNTLNGDK